MEGVQFSDKRVALRWVSEHSSTVFYDSIEDAIFVHGHDGATCLIWLDELPVLVE